jgi:hypothetical protein
LPVAFFSGAFLGAMVIALCAAAKRGDQAMGEMLRRLEEE